MQSHYSVKGAAASLGLGTDNCREVEVDSRGRMRAEHLEQLIAEDLAQGRRPFFVNCTAGTTVLGAFDPINAIADICEQHGVWLHVDVGARNPAQCYQCRRAGCVGRRPADVPHGAAGEVRGRGEGGQPHLEPAQAAGGAAAVLHPPPQGEG